MTKTILIVEDESDLAGVLAYNADREGFSAIPVKNGAEALKILMDGPLPDIVLLDLMLPDISGIDVCRQMRAMDQTRCIPVLMLTARTDENDRVHGFEVGADDYVTKPFSVRELMMRIRALLRRSANGASGDKSSEDAFGLLRLDRDAHRVWVDGREVALTALEFRLLDVFLDRKGHVQPRDRLLSCVWNIHFDITTRTVDTHVKRLREKLGPAGSYIETVRGVGYRFRSSPGEED